ncbi:MAG: type IV pilus secretin PilQ [Deltaproteobacteria bacterium]|nr:type IV pilus secretin PilQ [Deltaproteobacteria bacterium]
MAEDLKDAAVAAQKQSNKVVIESVSVVGAGDRVLIKANGPVKYTTFKLTEPDRVLIDMPGVDVDKIQPQLDVNNRYIIVIKTFAVGGEEKIGRVIIELQKGVENFVKEGENSLLVSLASENAPPSDAQTAAAVPVTAPEIAPETAPKTAVEPVTGVQPLQTEGAASKAAEQKTDEVKEEAAAPAGKILKVESSEETGKTVVTFTADGAVGNYKSFRLNKPSRVIVDVWGVTNLTGKSVFPVKGKYVKSVRIGAYKDKLRLVVDLAGKAAVPYLVIKADKSLVLNVGESVIADKATQTSQAPAPAVAAPVEAASVKAAPVEAAPAAAVAAAAAPVQMETAASSAKQAEPAQQAEQAAKVEEKEAAEVTRVDYKMAGPKGRLTVASSVSAPYAIKESDDGRTIVMDIKDAVIREELVRTLDATKLGTAVTSISAFQESFKPNNVRILIKLSEKTAYEVKEDAGKLSLDFAVIAGIKKEGEVEASAAQYAGKKIDLDMIDASVADVLRLLAEVSNLNIIASDDVKGTVSLRLKNVPWEQAFDIILKSKDLDKVQEGNVVRVAPTSRLRQERETALAAKKAQEKLEDLMIKYVAVNYADAKDLEPQVKGVLTDRGSVSSEKRTNTLIIKDVKNGLEKAAELIRRLDTQIPQVIIEARIVEAETTFARDLGIQWGVDYRNPNNTTTNLFGSADRFGQWAVDPAQSQGPTGMLTGGGSSNIEKKNFLATPGVTNYMVNMPASGKAGPLGALGMLLGKSGVNPLMLDLRLTAGETEGRVRTISRPRVTTMDNKEAKIEQGESIPFSTTSSAGTATTFIEANLSLTVTPHITPDGSVIMKIKATRNAIGSFRTSSGSPSINKKEATTEVLVKDGETTVIGGIVISDKSETESGIPYLKDIPFLGVLFKSKSVSDSQTELLIFITPTIVKDRIVS